MELSKASNSNISADDQLEQEDDDDDVNIQPQQGIQGDDSRRQWAVDTDVTCTDGDNVMVSDGFTGRSNRNKKKVGWEEGHMIAESPDLNWPMGVKSPSFYCFF